MAEHRYELEVSWSGTSTSARDYIRDHVVRIAGKPDVLGSSDAPFRGDASRHNPEDMLLAALSSCHMLSYLYVCMRADVDVVAYTDRPTATLAVDRDGTGRFTGATLRPQLVVAEAAMVDAAASLNDDAAKGCFVAASLGFPVRYEPTVHAGD